MNLFKLFMYWEFGVTEEEAAKNNEIRQKEFLKEKRKHCLAERRKWNEKVANCKKKRREAAIRKEEAYAEWQAKTPKNRKRWWEQMVQYKTRMWNNLGRFYEGRAKKFTNPATGRYWIYDTKEKRTHFYSEEFEYKWRNWYLDQRFRFYRCLWWNKRVYKRTLKRVTEAYFYKEEMMRGQNWQLEFFVYLKVFVCICIFCFSACLTYYLINRIYYTWFYVLETKKNKNRRFYYACYVLQKKPIVETYDRYKNPNLKDLQISPLKIKLLLYVKYLNNNFLCYIYQSQTFKKYAALITTYWEKTTTFFNEYVPVLWNHYKTKVVQDYTKLEKTNKLFSFSTKILFLILMFSIAFLATILLLRVQHIILFPFKTAIYWVDIIAVLETNNFGTLYINSEFWNRCIFAVGLMILAVIGLTISVFVEIKNKMKVYKQEYEQEKEITKEFDKKYAKEIEAWNKENGF